MNEDVHGANATFHLKNLNGITIAKMVNFVVKGCMKFQYVRVASSDYPIRSRSCIICRDAVCRYSGKETASTVMVDKWCTSSSSSSSNK